MPGERGPLPTGYARRRNKRSDTGRSVLVKRPPMPSFLQGEARAEWRRVVPQLEKMNMLATVDRGVLIRYCTAWKDWWELNDLLQKSSKLVQRREGLVRNPLWMMRADAEATLSDLTKQLGLTPNARIRAGVVHEPAMDEPDEAGPTAIDSYRARLMKS